MQKSHCTLLRVVATNFVQFHSQSAQFINFPLTCFQISAHPNKFKSNPSKIPSNFHVTRQAVKTEITLATDGYLTHRTTLRQAKLYCIIHLNALSLRAHKNKIQL